MSASRQRGFTLVELVVTIALLAVLTTLAAPTFAELLRQWQRDSATRELTTSLQLARSESIKSSRQMVVCPSTDGSNCAASNEWNTGWIVFVDDGADTFANANNQTLDADERTLKVASAQSGIASLTSPNDVQWVQFLPNGIMRTGSGSGVDITFTVTPSGATAATQVDKINVSLVGRVTVVTELP
jgi:type IV fimbrial biogenesis protein FimT